MVRTSVSNFYKVSACNPHTFLVLFTVHLDQRGEEDDEGCGVCLCVARKNA